MRNIVFFLLLFIIIGCDNRQKHLVKIVQTWQNKQIIFPDSIIIKIAGRDTISDDILNDKYIIFNYIDTTGCLPCHLKLYDWHCLKKEIDSLNLKVEIIFSIYSNDYKTIETGQQINHAEFPTIYDYNNEMNRINSFPESTLFRTFLLDSNKTVLLIGNPLSSKYLWELYKEKIKT